MVATPPAFNGIVGFLTLLTSSDACSSSGQSRAYAIDYSIGRTALATGAAFVQYCTAITDLKFTGVDGKAGLIFSDVGGDLRNIGFKPPASNALRLLNWREVPTPGRQPKLGGGGAALRPGSRYGQEKGNDVTEFNGDGRKPYLSPVMDLYNGEIVAYEMQRRPVFPLVGNMLKKALSKLAG